MLREGKSRSTVLFAALGALGSASVSAAFANLSRGAKT
jgi:hypothetical protein